MPVTLRFYEELNDFLPRARRKTVFIVPYDKPRSVKDLIESLGVPHTEVDLILVNGESVGFDCPVRDGARISVYPVFESLDITAVSRLGRPPLRDIKFVADVHLAKLAKRLRLLGFDCRWNRAWNDDELAAISAETNRVLLTRDRGLLKRAVVTHGIYIRSDRPGDQLRQVVGRLDLGSKLNPFTRCLKCSGLLVSVPEEEVREHVPPRTRQYIHEYCRCPDCGQIYWQGTHWDTLNRIIAEAVS